MLAPEVESVAELLSGRIMSRGTPDNPFISTPVPLDLVLAMEEEAPSSKVRVLMVMLLEESATDAPRTTLNGALEVRVTVPLLTVVEPFKLTLLPAALRARVPVGRDTAPLMVIPPAVEVRSTVLPVADPLIEETVMLPAPDWVRLKVELKVRAPKLRSPVLVRLSTPPVALAVIPSRVMAPVPEEMDAVPEAL